MDSMQVSPNPYIDKAVATVLVPMRVAARYPGVESVVCTGSTRAVTTPCLDTPIKGTETTWNHAAVEAAYAPTYTDAALHAHAVYSAQFVKKEQAAYWFWTRTNPHYRFNIVAVSVTWGQIVSTANQGYLSTSGFLNGPENFLVMASRLVPHWCCDVQDMAQLHVAAATGSDVTNERIFAFVL
ncbi:hypothetical protein H2203_000991 [Taxawa tesnikishii (nom. ined.)]|nr:hypothetical protein H2203_000991 [Dothideales sp. JES 119]